jgi:glycosyltransferase involved in cell wall biosynthesis
MITAIPKVSIITPSYNQGQFIEATIQSVLNQTYANIEYIVADGGSTDQTMSLVEHYQAQIDVVIHEKDKGQSDAINKGLRRATGELVGWINSDDLLYPDCVARMVQCYQRTADGAVYYGSALDRIDADGKCTGMHSIHIPDRKHLLNYNYDIIQPGSFYPASIVHQVGYLNEHIHYCMDLDLWLRLLTQGPIYAYADEPMAGFRIWGDSKTSTGGYRFLDDIIGVLKQNGADSYARTLLQARYQRLRKRMKARLTFV